MPPDRGGSSCDPQPATRPTANVDLRGRVHGGRYAAEADFTVTSIILIEQAGGDPVFGAVAKEAESVEMRVE